MYNFFFSSLDVYRASAYPTVVDYHYPFVLMKRMMILVYCHCIIASTELGTTTLFAMTCYVTNIGDTRERLTTNFKALYDSGTSSVPSEVSCCCC